MPRSPWASRRARAVSEDTSPVCSTSATALSQKLGAPTAAATVMANSRRVLFMQDLRFQGSPDYAAKVSNFLGYEGRPCRGGLSPPVFIRLNFKSGGHRPPLQGPN